MSEEREKEILEFMDDVADDLRKTRAKSTVRKPWNLLETLHPKALLIGGAGIFVLFIVVLFFVFGGKQSPAPAEDPIQARINQLEERVAQLEQGNEDILQAIDELKNRIAAIGKKKTSSRKRRNTSAPSSSRRYHIVRQGDTLYRIAKKYGISIDDLKRLNRNLSKDQPIHPGQKLLVAP
ncbi:MAG: LysM peptidoglycan-binding domain-containing protein [Deltaproteobacteria bacterium]|nr:LysM peptidoglycan-binding domain-containing protein [Deltaproteobacteria bacterium]